MPQFYTLQTNNAFAALDSNSDNDEVILSAEQVTKQEKVSTKEKQKTQVKPKQNKREKGEKSETNKSNTLAKEPAAEVNQNESNSVDDQGEPTRRRTYRGRGRGRGLPRESNTRSHRRYEGGRGREIKKRGAGAHAWGTVHVSKNQAVEEAEIKNNGAERENEEKERKVHRKPQNNVVTYAEYAAAQGDEYVLSEKTPTKSTDTTTVEVYTKVGERAVVKNARTQETKNVITPLEESVGVPIKFVAKSFRSRRQPRHNDNHNRNREKKQAIISIDDNKAFPTI